MALLTLLDLHYVGGRRVAMRRFIICMVVLTILGVAGSKQLEATTIYLSDYMGVASGQSTNTSNSPYTTITAPGPWEFGVDTLGNWTSTPIDFSDTGPFAKGIGASPDNFGSNQIDFNLDAFRANVGVFDTFSSVVGISDEPGFPVNHGTTGGATFEVWLDGVMAISQAVPNIDSGSFNISINVQQSVSQLSLAVSRLGVWNYNNAAWADAKLSGTPVPEPTTIALLGVGLAGLAGTVLRRRLKRVKQ